MNVDEIIKQIEHQIADRNLKVAQYYEKTGYTLAANLYYDQVLNDWPNTQAAEQIRELKDKK